MQGLQLPQRLTDNGRQRRSHRLFTDAARRRILRAMSPGDGEINRADEPAHCCRRSATHHRQPSAEKLHQTPQKTLEAIVHDHITGPRGDLQQRAVEIEEETCIAEQAARWGRQGPRRALFGATDRRDKVTVP